MLVSLCGKNQGSTAYAYAYAYALLFFFRGLAAGLTLALAARLTLALATRFLLVATPGLCIQDLSLRFAGSTKLLDSLLALAATRFLLALAARFLLGLSLGLSLGSPAMPGLYVVDFALRFAGSTKLLDSLLALAATRLTLALATRLTLALATRLTLALATRFLLALAARFLLVATPGLCIQDLALRFAESPKFLQGLLLGLTPGLTPGLTLGLTFFRIVATGLAQVPFVPSVWSALVATPGLYIQDLTPTFASCSKFPQGLLTALTAAR